MGHLRKIFTYLLTSVLMVIVHVKWTDQFLLDFIPPSGLDLNLGDKWHGFLQAGWPS